VWLRPTENTSINWLTSTERAHIRHPYAPELGDVAARRARLVLLRLKRLEQLECGLVRINAIPHIEPRRPHNGEKIDQDVDDIDQLARRVAKLVTFEEMAKFAAPEAQ
jgi:hypothetical protein